LEKVDKHHVAGHVIKNVNEEFHKQLTSGQRVADKVAKVVGSWSFIIFQSIIIIIWMAVNAFLVYKVAVDPDYMQAWDPYPFILLNLVLSFQAAYTGPVVMMSQNRQAEKDRLMAEHDYQINLKAEVEIQELRKQLNRQEAMITEILASLNQLSNPELKK
jgi:uncharacterized membrane protein